MSRVFFVEMVLLLYTWQLSFIHGLDWKNAIKQPVWDSCNLYLSFSGLGSQPPSSSSFECTK